MKPSVFNIVLPRNAFSPRERGRAGDLWRACQDAAVFESIQVGWPPARYVETGTSFIVRSMTAVHERETSYGDALKAHTWVSRTRRDMFSTREVRIDGPQGRVVSATQEWVHVASDLSPTRASGDLLASFPSIEVAGEKSVELPPIARTLEGRTHTLSFRCWHTWMDPLAHVNHPVYIDWCDESVSAAMRSAGLMPVELVPVAEHATFKSGVVADQTVTVSSHVRGVTEFGHVVFGHRVVDDAGKVCATATTIRRLATGSSAQLLDGLV